jgi:hypothetical protein
MQVESLELEQTKIARPKANKFRLTQESSLIDSVLLKLQSFKASMNLAGCASVSRASMKG